MSWEAVLLKEGEEYTVNDQLLAPYGYDQGKLDTHIRDYNKIGVKPSVLGPAGRAPRGKIRGHERGYWVLRYKEENEFGVESPQGRRSMSYKILNIKPGEEYPSIGKIERKDRLHRLQAFLREECLDSMGSYFARPERFEEDHPVYRDEFDDNKYAEEEMVVLVWEKDEEVNEWGKVCP